MLDTEQSTREKKKKIKKYWMLVLTANIFRPFGIDQKTLNELHEDKNFVLLEDLGGVNGVARALKTSEGRRIADDGDNIHR